MVRDAAFHIPLDENNNDIADSWEDAKHIFTQSLRPNDDSEPPPSGMTQKGDGFTLFEEYRGFVAEDGSTLVHTQLDPLKQDLLVSAYDEPHRDDLIAAAMMFGEVTKIPITVIHGKGQLQWLDGDMATYNTRNGPLDLHTMPRWVNFNALPGDTIHFGPKQVAMRVFTAAIGTGNSAPNDGSGGVVSTPHGDIPYSHAPIGYVGAAVSWSAIEDQLHIWIRNLQGHNEHRLERALTEGHFIREKVIEMASDERKFAEVHRRFFRFAVMHEMGHNLGAAHHLEQLNLDGKITVDDVNQDFYSKGEKSCPMRYWQYAEVGTEIIKLMIEAWDPTETWQWHFCKENVRQMKLHD